MQKRFYFLKISHPNKGLLFWIVNILYLYCNTVNVSEGKEKISAGFIISFAGSIHLDRNETSSCKLGCLQWLSLPTPVPAWTPCVLRTVQSSELQFTGSSTRALCNSCTSSLFLLWILCLFSFLCLSLWADQRKCSLWFQSFGTKWQ